MSTIAEHGIDASKPTIQAALGKLGPVSSYFTTTSGKPYIDLGWLPSTAYSFNDVVYINGTWWRCITAQQVEQVSPLPIGKTR